MVDSLANYNHRLQLLLEVCRNLSGHLDLDPLLNAIIESSSELTFSETSSILLFDAATQKLRFAAAPWYSLEKMKQIEVPLDDSVAGWAFTHIQPYMIYHAEEDRRINRAADRELNFVTRSILAVPLTFRGKAIGVLEAVNKVNDSHYNDEDVIILETLASQAAIAIENHRLLAEAQQAYHKAIELDHMKSDFIAIASHELRTPLGVILGHATFLEETAPPDQREELGAIVRGAMRLKEIIENFANIDQFENGLSRVRRNRIILQQMVQEVGDSLRDLAAERQVKLVLHLAQKHQLVECDGGKVAVALRELIKNGLIFTNPGGQVHVRCESVPGFVKLSVSDNGIGIAPAEQAKIFERFYQVENHLTRRHGGLGLGLSIARNMIEMHGGRIWVESVEGKGSRFTFMLPVEVAPSAAAAESVFL